MKKVSKRYSRLRSIAIKFAKAFEAWEKSPEGRIAYEQRMIEEHKENIRSLKKQS